MPTYEYECIDCGYTFEVFQRMMDNPLKKCPKCKKKVKRLISGGAGIICKGNPRKGIKIIRQKKVKISDYLRQQKANEKKRKESNAFLREQREEIINKWK